MVWPEAGVTVRKGALPLSVAVKWLRAATAGVANEQRDADRNKISVNTIQNKRGGRYLELRIGAGYMEGHRLGDGRLAIRKHQHDPPDGVTGRERGRVR